MRSYELSQLQDRIDLLRIGHNISLADVLSDQLEIRQRQRELVDQMALSEEEALARATAYVEARREALNIEREHQIELRDLNTALEIARTSGDERAQRAIERRLELESRIAELRDLGVGEDQATTQAAREVEALERADLQGKFRGWFGDGVMAALDGDLGEFFRNWAAERMESALRDALDRVADAIFNAFDGVLSRVMSDGVSDIGGAITGAVSGGANGGLTKLGEDAAGVANVLKGQLAAAAVTAAARETASSVSKATSTANVVAANAFLASSAKLAAVALQQLASSSGGKSKAACSATSSAPSPAAAKAASNLAAAKPSAGRSIPASSTKFTKTNSLRRACRASLSRRT